MKRFIKQHKLSGGFSGNNTTYDINEHELSMTNEQVLFI